MSKITIMLSIFFSCLLHYSYAQNIVQLAVGNQWTSRDTQYDSLGIVTQTYEFTSRVQRDTMISTETWFTFEPSGQNWFTNLADGLYMYRLGYLPFLHIKYPAIVGETYLSELHGDSVKVTSINTLITVPSGTFSCYVYEVKRPTDDYPYKVWYLSPNICFIKEKTYKKTSGGSIYLWSNIELLSYSIVNSINDNINYPSGYSLFQNFPNPFNPSTRISFSIPHTGDVTLSIYDLLGQRIETLVDGKQYVGVHEVRWDASRFPSGVYFYQLKSKDYTETKKLLLAK